MIPDFFFLPDFNILHFFKPNLFIYFFVLILSLFSRFSTYFLPFSPQFFSQLSFSKEGNVVRFYFFPSESPLFFFSAHYDPWFNEWNKLEPGRIEYHTFLISFSCPDISCDGTRAWYVCWYCPCSGQYDLTSKVHVRLQTLLHHPWQWVQGVYHKNPSTVSTAKRAFRRNI